MGPLVSLGALTLPRLEKGSPKGGLTVYEEIEGEGFLGRILADRINFCDDYIPEVAYMSSTCKEN